MRTLETGTPQRLFSCDSMEAGDDLMIIYLDLSSVRFDHSTVDALEGNPRSPEPDR